jgi:hypothetical protein
MNNEPVNCTSSELSIYLQGLEAGFLPTYCSDTTPCAQSRSNPIASKCYQHGKKTVTFHGFPSLMMCKYSTASHGGDLLTLSQEDSHARTLAAQEKERDLAESAADYGAKCGESLAKYDLHTRSWRTRQCLLFEDSTECLEILPRWGMMRNGELFRRQIAALPMSGKEYGFLPTPVKHDQKDACYPSEFRRNTPPLSTHAGGRINPEWHEWLMGFPINWTALDQLETRKFQLWRQRHGEF